MLNEKIIIITGGAGLIGREFAKAVAEQRGIPVIADIDETAANTVRDEILAANPGARAESVRLDITDKQSITQMLDCLHEKYGRIDALVNNAYPRNKNYGREFFAVEYRDFCENLNINLGGYFLTSQQAALYFERQGYGNIVNIASIYGVVAPKFEIYAGTPMTMPVEYAAIKSALIQLTKYLAKYLKGKNIRVNAISPGGIFNHQPEAFLEKYNSNCLNKGMLENKDLCGTLVYLLSEMSAYVNGQNIIVDDGFVL